MIYQYINGYNIFREEVIWMIKRELYLNQIRPFIGDELIKVITGIRRSGKSSVLKMLIDEIKESGVSEDNIIYVNFESMEYDEITEAKELYAFIKNKIVNNAKYYILLDEIQEVEAWEKAINSFLVDFNVDVYITGPNSKLLSSELATYIAGRYVEFNITPLSFLESIQFHKEKTGETETDLEKHIESYIRLGGFPVIHTGD